MIATKPGALPNLQAVVPHTNLHAPRMTGFHAIRMITLACHRHFLLFVPAFTCVANLGIHILVRVFCPWFFILLFAILLFLFARVFVINLLRRVLSAKSDISQVRNRTFRKCEIGHFASAKSELRISHISKVRNRTLRISRISQVRNRTFRISQVRNRTLRISQVRNRTLCRFRTRTLRRQTLSESVWRRM